MTMTRLLMISTLVLAGLVLLPLQASAQRLSTQAANASAPAPAPPPAAAADPAPRPVATTGSAGSPRAWYEEDYRLGPGDKLRIEVYGQQQLSQSLQIRPDGKITLPLVGDVLAAGKTSMQVRDDLARAFKDYVHNPVVTVIVQEATSSQVYVIGEVSAPGAQVLEGPTTILQALAQAGGLKEFADKGHIHVLRKSASGTRTIPVDYKGALKGDVDPMVLQPGDTLVVP
jgi:polysaccharide export outer membrane protein